jgi:hypothetical protein
MSRLCRSCACAPPEHTPGEPSGCCRISARYCTPCGCNNFNRRFVPPDAVHLILATPCGLHYPRHYLTYFLLFTCASRARYSLRREVQFVVNRGRGARHEAPLPGRRHPRQRVPGGTLSWYYIRSTDSRALQLISPISPIWLIHDELSLKKGQLTA